MSNRPAYVPRWRFATAVIVALLAIVVAVAVVTYRPPAPLCPSPTHPASKG